MERAAGPSHPTAPELTPVNIMPRVLHAGVGNPPVSRTPDPTPARTDGTSPVRPPYQPDLRRAYLAACDRWTEADRAHHQASVAVATGTGSVEALAVAEADRDSAMGEVVMTRDHLAGQLLDMVRACMADEYTRHALLMALVEAMRPALEPVADRLADLETVVAARRTKA